MSDEHADLRRNRESTERLRALVAGLEEAELRRPLGGGWTVGFALAHLAFWDQRQRLAIQRHARGEGFPGEDPTVNEALDAVAPLLTTGRAGCEAVRAAALLDETLAALASAEWDELIAAGEGYSLERWRHRDEHIAQIEAALT